MQKKAKETLGDVFRTSIAARDGQMPQYRVKPKHILQAKAGSSWSGLGYVEKRYIGVLKVRPVNLRDGLGYRVSARITKKSVPYKA